MYDHSNPNYRGQMLVSIPKEVAEYAIKLNTRSISSNIVAKREDDGDSKSLAVFVYDDWLQLERVWTQGFVGRPKQRAASFSVSSHDHGVLNRSDCGTDESRDASFSSVDVITPDKSLNVC
ncbi:hypothetical protein CEUSTIGMA_g1333.t1 [Chlamydomonas eustigma]|uniref:Uncharacterized protein n=1 Tax=Chlamydomonas eustigma TaxID=1157962 RepID=A0A250WST7_9CHLO|nr:hypothetical protein CEUSTIGMA_g1333.t1 [Chlamydomonas eustigma]|eukprot:GAX73883.1 hypothetical protein CEUSTIGMA_g1333.t1 [Chlamydomonas eustigma]